MDLSPLQLAALNPDSAWMARLMADDRGYSKWLVGKETFAETMSGIMDEKMDPVKKLEFKSKMNWGIVALR